MRKKQLTRDPKMFKKKIAKKKIPSKDNLIKHIKKFKKKIKLNKHIYPENEEYFVNLNQ